jgi:mannose-6-phosphate isomerase
VKKGDFINVTPGLVHASLEGSIIICEVQQNSDTTYRIYDFDRLVDGELRELHLDKAMDVIDFNKKPEISDDLSRENRKIQGGILQEVIRDKYFNIDKLVLDSKYIDEKKDSFMIFSILDGEEVLMYEDKKLNIKRGETWYIPPKINVTLEGKLEILKTFM